MTKRTLNRRQMMGMAGAGLALLSSRAARATAGALADWATPDLVVLNARIYTMDPTPPLAEAFAVKDGRFVALGSTHDIKGLGGKTQTIDAQPKTILPRVIDSHNQPPGNKFFYQRLVGKPLQGGIFTRGSINAKLRVKEQKNAAG